MFLYEILLRMRMFREVFVFFLFFFPGMLVAQLHIYLPVEPEVVVVPQA